MSCKEKIRARFSVEGLRTQRLARVFEDRDLALRPGEGSMTSAELLAHLVAGRNFLRGLFTEKEPSTELFKISVDTNSVAALLRQLAESWRAVIAAIDKADDEWLHGEISPFGPDSKISRAEMADFIIDHEIHHRGQLSVYVRVAGKVPPPLYAPVTEDVLEVSPKG
jgi:uncharacterized damage-inducible protein DinB